MYMYMARDQYKTISEKKTLELLISTCNVITRVSTIATVYCNKQTLHVLCYNTVYYVCKRTCTHMYR